MTTILIKKKDTAGAPAAGDLTNVAGGTEIAVNTATKRIYTKDSSGNVVELGTNPSAITGNLLFSPDNSLDIGASGTSRPRSLFLGTNITVGSLTSTRVPFASTGGLLVDSANLTFNGTDLTVSGAVNAGTINTTTLDLTNLEVTNIKAKDGTAGMQIADSTGVVSFTANPILSGGTANGVAYLNGSKVLTTGSALTFDGTRLGISGGTNGSRFSVRGAGAVGGFDTGAAADGRIEYAYNGTDIFYTGMDSASLMTLMARSGVSLAFGANGSEQMRLTSTGLGIGTSSPAYKLDVAGTINSGASTATGYNHVFRTSGITTGRAQTSLTNTSGDFWTGVEGSTAGQTLTGSAAYSAFAGTFTANPLYLVTSGSIRATLDSSGNLGLGVTPSAWESSYRVTQLASTGAFVAGRTTTTAAILGSNASRDTGGTWRYTGSAPAARLEILDSAYQFFTAPSGTAGNAITFTQAMTLDASGDFLVGTTASGGQSGFAVLKGNFGIETRIEIAHNFGTASGVKYVDFLYATGTIGSITQNGTTAVAYNTSSDYRLKNITGPITTSGAYIDSLNPVEGTWKADGSTFVGLIAHEVQEASRTAVATGVKDGEQMQGMDYSSAEIIANLIAEVKALRTRVAALESI